MFAFLAIWLTACGGLREPQQDIRYFSTHAEGRPPLSWELRVWTPNKATLKATYTNTAPGGIAEGFRWSVRGDGNCEQMRFQAVPSQVDIAARDVVQLLVDGQPAFYGYIETAWPAGDGRLREYVAVGAAELLRQRLMDTATYAQQDVAAIVRDIASRLLPPAITYDAARVPDTGAVLELGPSVLVPLNKVIEDLARSVGGIAWGVDSTGTFFFAPPSGSASVGYEEQGLNWLPVQSEEIVTRVALWMAIPPVPSTADTWEAISAVGVGYTERDLPNRYYIHYYEDPLHSTYGAEKAFVYRDSAVPWASRGGSVASSTVTNPNNATDGDNTTYAAGPGDLILFPGLGTQRYAPRVTIIYESTEPGGTATLSHTCTNVGIITGEFIRIDLPDTGGQKRLIELVLPVLGPSGFCETSGTKLELIGIPNTGKVYAVVFYEYDAVRLDDYARSLIRLPYQTPAEVEWHGYHPPVRYLIVTGAPGGDLTGEVETWEYEWTSRRMRSVARMGSRGADPAARAIRILADRRREEAEGTALALTRRR